ncbi:MAG: hypothetical protein H7177_09065 [Rhizobacter sp.]|nr:hypothetical protein [Bacteriovorax sp.]
MLEKLITNLKNSLPEPLRKKMGMVEDSEDNSDDDSEENELQKYESDDTADTGAEDKKKKSVSMIIRVVIILVLAYLAIDEFVLKKSAPTAGAPAAESSIEAKLSAKRKKRKVEADKAKAMATGSADASASAATTAQVPDAPKDSTPPIENVNILDKNDPLNVAPVGATTAEIPAEKAAVEPPTEVISSKVIDTSVDHKIDQLVDNVDQSLPVGEIEEVKVPSQNETPAKKTSPKKEDSMASKIVEEVSETAPPAYDQVGRGLVYNCKDKYWACVDKPAYVNCNKNMKWNKSKGSSMECVVQNIYSTDDDCAKIQKYNVTTIQPTTFCH